MIVVKIKTYVWQMIGVVGVVFWCVSFINTPSFPTLDRLVFLLVFSFMIFRQGLEAIKRFLPFVALILVYESFRSIADKLNTYVNYTLAPHFDKALFGNLPTVYLQNWLWRGHVMWYDYTFYIAYMCHFILPLVLGVLVWKTREKYYWQVMWTYIVVSFAGFLTFLIFPAAPPWLASQNHYIQPIVRISSEVWASLGIKDFPSFYEHVAPNSVAAIPSLHAAWAALLFIFVFKLYGRRWGLLAAVYPLLIFVGTVYEGDHYAFDVLLGVIYALGAYYATPYLISLAKKVLNASGLTEFRNRKLQRHTSKS